MQIWLRPPNAAETPVGGNQGFARGRSGQGKTRLTVLSGKRHGHRCGSASAPCGVAIGTTRTGAAERCASATSEENRDRLSHSRVRRPSLTRRREADHRLAIGVPLRAEMRLLLLGQKLHQLLDVSVQQVDRRDFAGMGSDPHDKILADSIDDEEAVIVTADREPTGMA